MAGPAADPYAAAVADLMPTPAATSGPDPYAAAALQATGGTRAPDVSAGEAALIGAGHFAATSLAGLRQKLGWALGDAGTEAFNAIASKVPGLMETLQTAQNPNDPIYGQLEKEHPMATFLGSAAPQLAAKTPIGMALLGGLQYAPAPESAMNAALGFAGGAAGNLLGKGVARLFGPRSMDAAAGSTASQFFPGSSVNPYDIPMSVGQATQFRPAQIAETVLENLPFSAGTMASARDATFTGFNRAVGRTFGRDTPELTPQVLGTARQDIGSQIGSIAQRNQLVVDPQFAQDIARWSAWGQDNLTGEAAARFNQRISDVINHIDPSTGTIPGTFYHASDSTLGRLARNTADSDLAYGAGQLRQTLRDAFDRSISPQDAAEWATSRRQYQNLRIAADALRNSPQGNMSPRQLLTQVNLSQPNARFGSGTDLASLAQWAAPNIGEAIPNSGTAQRALYQRFLTNPLTSAAGVAGGIYGAEKAGLDPEDLLAAPLLMYGAARGMAGAPASAFTRALLARGGQALGGTTLLDIAGGQR